MPDELMSLIPTVHVASTWFMVGLIWFVQAVHYPLFASVPAEVSCAYALQHQRRTTWVVAPVMLIESATAIAIFWAPSGAFAGTPLRWIGLGLLAVVWLSTFALQVPLHGKLAIAFDDRVCRRLVATNWVRTFAWSARGIVALLMLSNR